jgi:hypothetical protein
MLVPLLLVGAVIVHTHDGADTGLYNHEHDLVLMAVLASVAPLPVLVVAVWIVVAALLVALPPPAPSVASRRFEASRAPPTA